MVDSQRASEPLRFRGQNERVVFDIEGEFFFGNSAGKRLERFHSQKNIIRNPRNRPERFVLHFVFGARSIWERDFGAQQNIFLRCEGSQPHCRRKGKERHQIFDQRKKNHEINRPSFHHQTRQNSKIRKLVLFTTGIHFRQKLLRLFK